MNRLTWDSNLLRACIVVLLGVSAATSHPFGLTATIAAIAGAAMGAAGVAIEVRLQRASLGATFGACAGAFVGLALGALFISALGSSSFNGPTSRFFRIAIPLLTGYLGLFIGIAKAQVLNLGSFGRASSEEALLSSKILDTSVLIDGRIFDIAEAGFLEGKLIIPLFVLHELQLVADSADTTKRNRGRRGLDIVQKLQKITRVEIELSAQEFPGIREVDLKLIELAKLQRFKLVTNDFNLNKLAQVQGIDVLNINELANAVRPVVLPGESMRIFISKEGKEHNQGVGYLDDGTMVVVDNARRSISKTVEITVTTVLQTTGGKMIFGKYDERHSGGEGRSGSGSSSSLSTATSAGASHG